MRRRQRGTRAQCGIVEPATLGYGLAMRLARSLAFVALTITAACSHHQNSAAIASVTVDQLDHMLANHECQAVDANGDATRRRMGVIPGAVLLRDMDAVDQLPADKSAGLVFYCANTACGAS